MFPPRCKLKRSGYHFLVMDLFILSEDVLFLRKTHFATAWNSLSIFASKPKDEKLWISLI